MSNTIWVADLFCCAGGSAMGIHQAMEESGLDHEIVGFDIKTMRRYPFHFVQQDALTVDLSGFDAVWASPPCQHHTLAAQQWRKAGVQYPDLIAPTRALLVGSGHPYVIENVPGSALVNPTVLNGATLGMLIRRTRWFETSFTMPLILLMPEAPSEIRMGRKPSPNSVLTPVGHFSGVDMARDRMGLPWMTQGELAQAIPPKYARCIWQQLIKQVWSDYGKHGQRIQPAEAPDPAYSAGVA